MITFLLLIVFRLKGGWIDRFLLWTMFDIIIEILMCLFLVYCWKN